MLTAGVMLTLAMGLMAGCGGEKKEAKKDAKVNVGIVQLVEHAALDAANKGFVDGMASKGYKEGQNVTYDRQNAQDPRHGFHKGDIRQMLRKSGGHDPVHLHRHEQGYHLPSR